MHAEILSWSRSRGVFAGVNLKGVVLKPEDDLNEAAYNRSAHELLGEETKKHPSPAAGLRAFPQTVSRYAPSSKGQQRASEN